ncbi:MAG: hypothetical protein ACI4HN_04055 [Ruminococcus sp.]
MKETDLLKDIIYDKIKKNKITVSISEKNVDIDRIVESTCYKALNEIKSILENDSLTDEECFLKIEEIIRVFERLGSNCGNRHDFS